MTPRSGQVLYTNGNGPVSSSVLGTVAAFAIPCCRCREPPGLIGRAASPGIAAVCAVVGDTSTRCSRPHFGLLLWRSQPGRPDHRGRHIHALTLPSSGGGSCCCDWERASCSSRRRSPAVSHRLVAGGAPATLPARI